MTVAPRWPMTWIRASLDLAVLASLSSGPLHGYAIAQELASLGFGVLKGGSLYPVLSRLEESGCLEAVWIEGSGGPGKREYHLTAMGHTRLGEDLAQWQELASTLVNMAKDAGSAP